MSKRRNHIRPVATFPVPLSDGRSMPFQVSQVKGATGYTIYGIAPIPVRIGTHGHVRIEPTANGYNVFEVEL